MLLTILGLVLNDFVCASKPVIVEEDGIRPHLAIGFYGGLDLVIEGLEHSVVRRQAAELVFCTLLAEECAVVRGASRWWLVEGEEESRTSSVKLLRSMKRQGRVSTKYSHQVTSLEGSR